MSGAACESGVRCKSLQSVHELGADDAQGQAASELVVVQAQHLQVHARVEGWQSGWAKQVFRDGLHVTSVCGDQCQ